MFYDFANTAQIPGCDFRIGCGQNDDIYITSLGVDQFAKANSLKKIVEMSNVGTRFASS